MKKNFKSTIKCLLVRLCLAGVGAFMFASSAYADGSIQSVERAEYTMGDSYDRWNDDIGTDYHSSRGSNNATTDYPKYADHATTQWQELGYTGGLGDYGVSWSTDGFHWGNDDLYVGDKVTFRFNMHSENVGNHYANMLKGWIDWGTDAGSYEFTNANDVVFGFKELWSDDPTGRSDYWAKNDLSYSEGDNNDSTYDFDNTDGLKSAYRNGYNYGGDDVAFEHTLTLDNRHLGTAYLRARVTCSDSLGKSIFSSYRWADQWSANATEYQEVFNAYDDYYQGEIEDWKFTVFGNPPGNPGTPIPEPTTLALFGMGLIGLARVGRKKA